MQRFRVFVTRQIPEDAIELLRRECEVEVNPEKRIPSKPELIEGVKGKDAVLCSLTDKIDEEIMDVAPSLKVISNFAVGYDNIDVGAATERGIVVTNTPGVLTETTADLAWATLMAIARRIPEADRFVRSGGWEGWEPKLFLGTDVYGKTLGIIGMGRIGSAVARRAKGFNMRVLYHDPCRREELEKELGVEYATLEDLLRLSDYVTVHVPLTPETKHMIGEKEFDLMKPTAKLINTSRGVVIDEQALIKALRTKRISGAALDVYESEPEVPKELMELENAVLLPHIGSASTETRTKMAMMAAENLLAVLRRKVPPNIVNREVLERVKLVE